MTSSGTIIKSSSTKNEACKHHRRNSSGGLRLRKNLIHKLGITPSSSNNNDGSSSCSTRADTRKIPVRSLLGNNPKITTEPLNDHAEFTRNNEDSFWNFGSFLLSLQRHQSPNDADKSEALASSLRTESSTISSSSRTSESGTIIEKRLSFHEEVSVCPIPRRDQYSNRIRTQLWPSMAEFTKRAESNTIEFASEGWDWRKTLEKEDMYLDTASGEYIHPIHVIIEQQRQAQTNQVEQQQESRGDNATESSVLNREGRH